MTVPGLDPTSSYSRHLAARFLDFTSPKTPWARRLWDLGSFLALEELHDVGEWLDRQVLSPRAVKWLQHDLEKQLGQDAAFGTRELSQQLTRCVKSDLTIRSDGRRRLRQIIDLARPGYLDRWAAEAARAEPPRAERVARAAATHLLDSGHSLPGLHRWLAERSTLSAVDLLTEAASLAALSPKQFRIWVPVISLPKPERLADPLPNFTRRSDLDPETAEQLQPTSTKPLLGAFSYDIEARDAERAVEVVIEVVERMRARARFTGVAGQVVVARQAYVATENRLIELRTPDRGALIMSLVSEGQLFDVNPAKTYAAQRHAIDDALELASPLNTGALAPAISGSWAALEALLTDAQDSDEDEGKVVAAVRAARLAACSWPRAELTALSYQVDEHTAAGKQLASKLQGVGTNRDRSEIVAAQLRQNNGLPLRRSWRFQSDIAAVARMNGLLADPAKVLNQVSGYVEASFRRMYRCRNVIVHGGSTRGDVLDSTLRVVAPLVGATLDRLTHAHLVLGIEPLQLATRADVAISMASDQKMGFDVVDLLGGS
ncbi:integrase [Mycobacterium timonense]|uniref:Integrase n=1 Tax=Mycobacterium timonense TaxID=701043 RepID=A0A7I9ZDP5_9MYCO|nr:integrase [Mycobacterium timonense]GFG99101.1 hypothetical protein MTIM_49800 [Mycobacterium timonense]